MAILPPPCGDLNGLIPYRFGVLTSAPCANQQLGGREIFGLNRQKSGGVPSGPGAFTSAFCSIRARTAATSPFFAAFHKT
jgi:hypothetical protein